MTERPFISSAADRLRQPHRQSSLVQSDAKSCAGNAQPIISRIEAGQSHSRTAWSTAFRTKIAAAKSTDPADSALSP